MTSPVVLFGARPGVDVRACMRVTVHEEGWAAGCPAYRREEEREQDGQETKKDNNIRTRATEGEGKEKGARS